MAHYRWQIAKTFAFTMPNDVPLIDLPYDGKKIPAHIDSRGQSLSLPRDTVCPVDWSCGAQVIGRGRTVSGEVELRGLKLTHDVAIGGYTFVQPFVEVNP
jgi:hypothetical protein